MPHHLLSCRRRVQVQRRADYLAHWDVLRAAAAAAGAHAWLFRDPADAAVYLEFVEWAAAPGDRDDPTRRPDMAAALDALARAFPAAPERWDEVAPTSEEKQP